MNPKDYFPPDCIMEVQGTGAADTNLEVFSVLKAAVGSRRA